MAETPASTYASSPPIAGAFPPVAAGHSLPSPAPSTASSRAAATLPHPRSKPLMRGSRKEDYARNYVSDRLMHISRRYVKKHGIPDPADEVKGYDSMDEVCEDLEEVVNVLWFSGTPSLQIPYLLNVALAFNTYLPSFAPSPRPTFALLKKLDHCFASLLVGRDVKSGEPLPGFQQRRDPGFSKTDMVRCKSIADETRILVATHMSDEPDVELFADDDVDEAAPPVGQNVGPSIPAKSTQSPVPHDSNEVAANGDGEQQEKDDDDDDDEDGDRIELEDDVRFEDVKGLNGEGASRPTTKRKRDDADLGESEEHGADDRKRVKVDGGANGSALAFSDATPAERSPTLTAGGPSRPGEQFHWMVDDDDDEDGEAAPGGSSGAAPLAPPRADDADYGEDVDVDDEDEELQMNVGRIYERTLVQLDRSLGGTLLGD
ncbi:hypothetical protein GGS23DRAFT_606627 [Durotheca rogersii]|uniref:uncharacterized protein n=1 Tax=Durotheca rogersii TaxID=419775 RepID=UPI002220D015|nr:uncharacterized protein GGS23DRAFT_606627 [Durotheca rogersii]KAI5860860.1 hypothetical protein GGS23DRAFT_606627 [Durotheca rogersii]